MSLDWIVEKYRKRTSIDVKDISEVLKAVPIFIRKMEELEDELQKARECIRLLELRVGQRPIMRHQGRKGDGHWDLRGDIANNLLVVQLSGIFNYFAAKQVSNILVDMLNQFREGMNMVIDLRKMKGEHNTRAYFHFRKVEFTMKEVGVNRVVLIFDAEKEPCGVTGLLYNRLKKTKAFKIYEASSIKKAIYFITDTSRHLPD